MVHGVVTDDAESAHRTAVEQLAFYGQFPPYARVLEPAGAARAGGVAVIGDPNGEIRSSWIAVR